MFQDGTPAVPMMANKLYGMIAPPITNKLKDGPIHWAAGRGDAATTERILQMEASQLDQVGVDLLTPLHWAARKGHEEVVALLLRRGARIDARDKFLQTPAHWAAWNGHHRALQELLEGGCNSNARDTKNCTPLYNAAYIGHPACMRVLLGFGADLSLGDDKGRPPLRVVCKWEFADHRHRAEIEDLLLNMKRPALLAPLSPSDSSLNFNHAGPTSNFNNGQPSYNYGTGGFNNGYANPSMGGNMGGNMSGNAGGNMGGSMGQYPLTSLQPSAPLGTMPSQRQQPLTATPLPRAVQFRGVAPPPMSQSILPSEDRQRPLLPSSASAPSLLGPSNGSRSLQRAHTQAAPLPPEYFSQHRPLFSLTKALFPFELTTNDYAHRGLDLLTTLLLGTCVRAVQFGVLPSLPPPACRDANDVDAHELLRFLIHWPVPEPSKEVFTHHLYSGQKAVSPRPIFRTTLDSMLDKVLEVRTVVAHRLTTYQRVTAPQVLLLLDLTGALAVLLGGGEGEREVTNEADRLRSQFMAHHKSLLSRLQGMQLDLPSSEGFAEPMSAGNQSFFGQP